MTSDSIRARLRDRGDLIPQTVDHVALAEALHTSEGTPLASRRPDAVPSLVYRSQSESPPPASLIVPPSASGGFAFAARRKKGVAKARQADPSRDLPELPPVAGDAD